MKCTSVFCAFHVEPCLIRLKIFRSRFFGSIVQLAEVLTNNEIVALTRDFFGTPEIAAVIPFNPIRFKGVASEEHSSNGVFCSWLTLGSSLKYTNSGHHERNCKPELGIHIELNASQLIATKEIKTFKSTSMIEPEKAGTSCLADFNETWQF